MNIVSDNQSFFKHAEEYFIFLAISGWNMKSSAIKIMVDPAYPNVLKSRNLIKDIRSPMWKVCR